MNRRASLPGASELFRATRPAPGSPPAPEPSDKTAGAARTTDPVEAASGGASGRVRHDHKITVYFSEDELLALEDANLELRRRHGIRVDRGRIVRIAVAKALTDLAELGGDSFLVDELGGN